MSIMDELKKLKLKIFEHKYQMLREFGEENHMFYTFEEAGLWDDLANVYYRGIPGDLIFRVYDSSNINDLVSKAIILAFTLGDANIIHATTQLSRTAAGDERRVLVESKGFIYDVATGEKIEGCLYDTMYCPKYDEVVPKSLYSESRVYRDLTTSLNEIKRPGFRREEARVATTAFSANVLATGDDKLINRFNGNLLEMNFEPITSEKTSSAKVYTKTEKKKSDD